MFMCCRDFGFCNVLVVANPACHAQEDTCLLAPVSRGGYACIATRHDLVGVQARDVAEGRLGTNLGQGDLREDSMSVYTGRAPGEVCGKMGVEEHPDDIAIATAVAIAGGEGGLTLAPKIAPTPFFSDPSPFRGLLEGLLVPRVAGLRPLSRGLAFEVVSRVHGHLYNLALHRSGAALFGSLLASSGRRLRHSSLQRQAHL